MMQRATKANQLAYDCPPRLAQELAEQPAMQARLAQLCAQVQKAQDACGVSFDAPLHLRDDANPFNISTMLVPRGDGAPAAKLNVPAGVLREDSPFDAEELGGIIMHELGHASHAKTELALQDVTLWRAMLTTITAGSLIAKNHPDFAQGYTEELGGNAAFLEQSEQMFAAVQNAVSPMIEACGENGKIGSPEALIEKLQRDAKLATALEHASALCCGQEEQGEQLCEAAQQLIKAAAAQQLTGKEFALTPSTIGTEKVDFLMNFAALERSVNHAIEYRADDFATRFTSSTKSLHSNHDHLPQDDQSHPPKAQRLERATRLDRCRKTMEATCGFIDEEAAVSRVNKEMQGLQRERVAAPAHQR